MAGGKHGLDAVRRGARSRAVNKYSTPKVVRPNPRVTDLVGESSAPTKNGRCLTAMASQFP